MIFKSKRLEERREGLGALHEIMKEKHRVLIIHYSCESFIPTHGRTPRVTSISIRYFKSGQTKSFSIHLQAQIDGLDFNDLTSEVCDGLEKRMLSDFYKFLREHADHRWIHWNMRDANYGFEAIANRYRILGGEPSYLAEDRKYDLPRILGLIYTYSYEDKLGDGRLLNLAKRNGITLSNAMLGSDEGKAYESKQFLQAHQSTLRKVDIIDTILDRIDKNDLKVNVGTKEIYGLTVPGIIEIVKNNWMLAALCSIILFFVSLYVQSLLST